MKVEYRDDLRGIDWRALKAALAADNFDNGRDPEELERSFDKSQGACIAWCEGEVVGTSRVLTDGVCNAYLLDVWTMSRFRRRGIAREMIERLSKSLTGQHIYLQAEKDLVEFYRRLGFGEQPFGMSRIVGKWLVKRAER